MGPFLTIYRNLPEPVHEVTRAFDGPWPQSAAASTVQSVMNLLHQSGPQLTGWVCEDNYIEKQLSRRIYQTQL